MSIRAPTVNPFPNAGGLAFVRFDHAAGDAGTVLFAPLDPVLGGSPAFPLQSEFLDSNNIEVAAVHRRLPQPQGCPA
jgi:hypothetical protein